MNHLTARVVIPLHVGCCRGRDDQEGASAGGALDECRSTMIRHYLRYIGILRAI